MLVLVLVVPLELSDICEPFFIWLVCSKFSVQYILCDELRIVRLTSASEVSVLDRGLDAFGSADSEHTLVVDLNTVSAIQVIIDPPVSFIRILLVDLFDFFCYSLVLADAFTDIAIQPLVICGS